MHFVMVILHLVALFAAWPALFITVPLHMILSAQRVKPPPGEYQNGVEPISPETHVRCPDCRELVRRDAKKCKHCGTQLTPQ